MKVLVYHWQDKVFFFYTAIYISVVEAAYVLTHIAHISRLPELVDSNFKIRHPPPPLPPPFLYNGIGSSCYDVFCPLDMRRPEMDYVSWTGLYL